MKKIIFLLLMLALLTGCSSKTKDDLAPYRSLTAAQIFNSGEASLAKGEYEQATKSFSALDALYPFGPYSEQGQLDIIYAYFMNDDSVSALASADRYIRLYPRDEHVDYAYYMKGIISFEQGRSYLQRKFNIDPAARDVNDKKQAFLAFNEVVNRFPDSPYAQDSLRRMIYIRNLMARSELLTADLYLQKKAYVAAANRASDVVAHYNGTSSVPDALAIMIKAYRALELNTLANNSLQILKASYPNSAAYKQVR